MFTPMRAENWKNVKDVLMQALDLDAAERRKFLDELPITEEIRDQVVSLLAVHKGSEGFMSVPASGIFSEFFGHDPVAEQQLTGQTIGVYEVVKELGIGGMGAVYLARRTDGKFDQQVAIKLLKREFNVGPTRESFKREIDIQSRLSHPNIARILDTGTTDDGIPYIVMEYIAGLAIDKFCRENDLSLTERLKLFNKACDAVAFAHQNLIVHRDLKPSNIIVPPDGIPKLLDFGISKLLDPHDGETSGVTIMGAMTPEYASPEQVNGGPVSTATDIYSLGVVLFKLLTGRHPYDHGNNISGDLLKEITDSEPILPSRAASASAEIEVPASELKGDLDNIILKALSKEPERRYSTVEQFSADIWRFNDGLPVIARPATFIYRASKFYRRNRISVIASAFVFLSLTVGVIVAVSQADAARRQAQIASEARSAAESETTRARSEQQKAEMINRFMGKLISFANPRWDAKGARSDGEAKVIDVLFEMSDRIDQEFPENIEVRAELHHKFAEVFQRITRPYYKNPRAPEARVKSVFHARQALELRKQFYGSHHEFVAQDLAYIVWTHEQEPADAAKTMAEAIQMMRETNPKNTNLPFMLGEYVGGLMLPNHSETAYDIKYPRENFHEVYRQAAIPATSENKYQIGERYLREALPMLRAQFTSDNYAIFVTECYLAYALAKQDKWADFDVPYQVCKQGETQVKDKVSLVGMRTVVGWVTRAIEEKDHPHIK